MKRRNFLKNVPLAVVPFFSNKLFAAPMSLTMEEAAMLTTATGEDRVLVIVQMDGGNDGLNTVLPLDQYTNLAAARSNILIPQSSALVLGNSQTGLHPAMTGMKTLFDQNKLCVVQGVSYANPNLSHFRSHDIMTTGSDANVVLTSGWLGRYLEYQYPGFPTAYPNVTMPDPLSIQIGYSVSPGLAGYEVTTAQMINPWFNGGLGQVQSFINGTTPSGNAGAEIQFLRSQQLAADSYANQINNAWNGGTNNMTYAASPTGVWNNLGNQLRIVARLIKGGLKTKVYWVRAGGYDTHDYQVDSSNKTQGSHANLLKELSDSIATFMADITSMGLEERVMGMTFSEFGRRVQSNSGVGTDHGTAGPMFMFGKYVNPGILGQNAAIPAVASWNTNVPTQFDYRQVYQAVLQGWFCVPAGTTASIIGSQTPTPSVNTSCLVSAPLPVELLRFDVSKANVNDAHVEWITANEQNISRFEIERSTDGENFRYVTAFKGKQHAHDAQIYSYLDKNLDTSKNLTFYYRLKIVETDGRENFTEIKSLTFQQGIKDISADVFPNPINDNILHVVLKGNYDKSATVEINLSDAYGRRLLSFTENGYESGQQLDFTLNEISANGVYFLSILHNNRNYVQRLIIQR
jgi:uncharacterized protein (DUF1501 family)